MNKNTLSFVSIIILAVMSSAMARIEPRNNGLGFRATWWKLPDQKNWIVAHHPDDFVEVDIGGGGGHLYLLSRVNDNMFMEMSVGGVGSVKAKASEWGADSVDVTAITPILVGFRFQLISVKSQSSTRPYISVGAGPYFQSFITVREDRHDEEVKTEWKAKRGGYAGGGFDLRLSNTFAFNIDVKYHFINFSVNNKYSGPEYGIGLQIMWGRYR